MALTTKVLLNKVRQKKDKTYPLVIRVTYNRKITYIPIGYTFLEKDFDSNNQKIRNSSKSVSNVTRLNNEIATKVKHVFDVISSLEINKQIDQMSMKEIKKAILGTSDDYLKTPLFSFYDKIIDEMTANGKFGNARVYKDSLKAWRNFRNEKDVEFRQINFKMLKSFENFFLAREAKPNTISVYLRTFRAVYNRAIKEGIISKDNHPFDHYKIPSNKTKKKAVGLDVIKKIESYNPLEGTRQWHCKHYFLFSFYCRGINFADMAYLKISNILGERLHYTRRKTGTEFNIKLHEKALSIMGFYSTGKSSDDYIFPIITTSKSKQTVYNQVNNKLHSYNHQLKLLSDELDLGIKLTTYTARHSYATGLKSKGISSEIIKESMGHKNVNITETYLKSFENEVVDNADDVLFGS